MEQNAVRLVMELYPRIYFACHRRHVRDAKSKRVLSAHQASILDHLDEREPVMLLELARHMGVTASTMSLQIEHLVRRGYVTRERDAKDGRRLRLRLSADGARVREANSVLDGDRVKKMLARLSSEERAAGLAGLALLARAAEEQSEELDKKRKKGRGRLPV
jgi:DNA-binding MarR family transcriptional regulator